MIKLCKSHYAICSIFFTLLWSSMLSPWLMILDRIHARRWGGFNRIDRSVNKTIIRSARIINNETRRTNDVISVDWSRIFRRIKRGQSAKLGSYTRITGRAKTSSVIRLLFVLAAYTMLSTRQGLVKQRRYRRSNLESRLHVIDYFNAFLC